MALRIRVAKPIHLPHFTHVASRLALAAPAGLASHREQSSVHLTVATGTAVQHGCLAHPAGVVLGDMQKPAHARSPSALCAVAWGASAHRSGPGSRLRGCPAAQLRPAARYLSTRVYSSVARGLRRSSPSSGAVCLSVGPALWAPSSALTRSSAPAQRCCLTATACFATRSGTGTGSRSTRRSRRRGCPRCGKWRSTASCSRVRARCMMGVHPLCHALTQCCSHSRWRQGAYDQVFH